MAHVAILQHRKIGRWKASMTHDQPASSSVRLKTEAYLQELSPPNQPIELHQPARESSALMSAWPILRLIPAAILGVALLAVGAQAMSVYDQEKDRRVCGVDWLLWASGSEKTFESILTDKLEDSRREFERQMEESRPKTTPLEIKHFDAKSVLGNPPLTGGQFRRK
jgi:hypothetical protein